MAQFRRDAAFFCGFGCCIFVSLPCNCFLSTLFYLVTLSLLCHAFASLSRFCFYRRPAVNFHCASLLRQESDRWNLRSGKAQFSSRIHRILAFSVAQVREFLSTYSPPKQITVALAVAFRVGIFSVAQITVARPFLPCEHTPTWLLPSLWTRLFGFFLSPWSRSLCEADLSLVAMLNIENEQGSASLWQDPPLRKRRILARRAS